MDTSDPDIAFDSNGVCNYVNHFRSTILKQWSPNGDPEKLNEVLSRIKSESVDKEYDCIIGISGGLDSSYLVHFAHVHQLRALVVHVDTGWNSELAVKNIEKLINRTSFDLETVVIDWPTMREIQLAFFRSGVPNQDIPQDHAIFASFYQKAIDHNIKWVLNGSNFSTESILPPAWGYSAGDWNHIKAIHNQYSKYSLKLYPNMGYVDYAFKLLFYGRLSIVKPLNLINYKQSNAIKILSEQYDWTYYGGKHYESRFTKFFQSWYLPSKHGYDKRRAHFSSLILSGDMTRSEALKLLSKPSYDAKELNNDKEYIANKLNISLDEFNLILDYPVKKHEDFKTSKRFLRLSKSLKRILFR